MKSKFYLVAVVATFFTLSCKKEQPCEKCQVSTESETSIIIDGDSFTARVKSMDSTMPEFITISNFKNPDLLNTINNILQQKKYYIKH